MNWCFLRSADGLDGIDYLRDTLLSDRTQFWVIGSGIVGWEYLKSTLKLHAYCGQTVLLPRLTGEDLQSWLKPLIEEFDVQFPDNALHKRLARPNNLLEEIDVSADKPIQALSDITSEIGQEVSATVQSSARSIKSKILSDRTTSPSKSTEEEYFERLAEISDGVSIVAVQLFLKSLRCKSLNDESLNDESLNDKENIDSKSKDLTVDEHARHPKNLKQNEENSHLQIVTTTPKLPPLPDLSQSDLYLLYSLMLHGDLTIKAMAKSLGDAPQVVNNQVQMLHSQDVIEKKGTVIKVNPVHYPRLRRELANNNFVIEVP